MKKIEVPPTAYLEETNRILKDCGLLLVSVGEDGRPNVMAIGWGLIGNLWRKPFFMVAVRPSRHTHKLIEETGDFTVNVPGKGMEETVDYCGTVSGRDHDKFRERNLTPVQGKMVESPIISECRIHYECKVAYKTKVKANQLPKEILSSSYPHGNYHTLYFGEIMATYADEDDEKNTWRMFRETPEICPFR